VEQGGQKVAERNREFNVRRAVGLDHHYMYGLDTNTTAEHARSGKSPRDQSRENLDGILG
jgi:hypothetical protein